MDKEPKDIKFYFSEALEKKTAEKRAEYLDEVCGDDIELRNKIEALLKAYDESDDVPEASIITLGTFDDSPVTEGSGTVIGRYKLLQQIGEGGFGVVYMAEQRKPIQRRVALKIIKLGMDTKQVIARFEAERQALALMDHPNIAKVLDAGATETGRPYFVMELVKGIPITEYCDENNLDTQQRLELFIDVCKAVQHAHQKGIIHRDIKPTNVLVTIRDDDSPVPKIIDFGIAKATQRPLTEKTLFTEFGQFVGTPQYMSPEQARMNELDIDTRSDIYSLGVLLYELLTGTTPFDPQMLRQAGYDEMQRIIREEEPARPSTKLSTLGEALTDIARHRRTEPNSLTKLIRGDLDWVVMKTLEKDRTRRYETANELARDIERHLGDEPVAAGPPSTVYRLRKFLRRNRALVTGIAAVLAVLVTGIVVSTIFAIGQFRARAEAMMFMQIMGAVDGYFKHGFFAKGPETTIREVLDTGSKELEGSSKFFEEMFGTHVEGFGHGILGRSYLGLGLYKEAEPHLERAHQFFRDELGEEHRITLASMSDLALLYQQQKRYDEAEPLVVKVLETKRRVLGEEDPGTLKSMTNLAWLYESQGRYDEAEQLFVKALEGNRRVLGEEHWDTLGLMNSLGWFYSDRGRYDEAEPLLVKVLEVYRRVQGEESPHTLRSMTNLARMYRDQGRYDEAEQLYVKMLDISRQMLGEKDSWTWWSRDNLASLYITEGHYDEGKSLLVKAVELDPYNIYNSYQIALLQLYTGDIEGYRKTCAGMLDHFTRSKRLDNAFGLTWAWTCSLAPDAVADLAHLAQAVKLAERVLEKVDKTNDYYLLTLGAILYRAGRFEEAIEKLEENVTIWEKEGRLPTQMSPAYTWFFLAMAHHQLGQHEEANKWVAKAAEWAEQEIAGKPSWGRQLTLELFGAEVEQLLGVSGQTDQNRKPEKAEGAQRG